jgi:hypothetical protein
MILIIPKTTFKKKDFRIAVRTTPGKLLKTPGETGSGDMVILSGQCLRSTGMKQFPILVSLVFLLLLAQMGIVSAVSPDTTPEKTGGSIYFDISPSGATIWLDNTEIGASPFTYFSEKTGMQEVLVRKNGFQDYTGTVTVINGTRVIFHAVLTPALSETPVVTPTVVPVTIATIAPKSTMKLPTPWPTATPASPADPLIVIGAAAFAVVLLVILRR